MALDVGTFVKTYLIGLIAVIVLLVFSAVGLVVYFSSRSNVSTLQREVDDIQQKLRDFGRFGCALNESNLEIAQQNREVARKLYADMRGRLDRRFAPLAVATETGLSKVALQKRIKARRGGMYESLKAAHVIGQEGDLGDFGFEPYLAPRWFPNPDRHDEEVGRILKQLSIIYEMVKIVAASRPTALTKLERVDKGKLELEDKGLYLFTAYRVEMEGNIASVQDFIRRLNESQLCFAIRDMEIVPTETLKVLVGESTATGGGGGGGGRERRPGAPRIPGLDFDGMDMGGRNPEPTRTENTEERPRERDKRIVVPHLVPMRAVFTIDYIEFAPLEKEDS